MKDINMFKYNRFIIVGNNGSGKSYLAKELSAITQLPLIHLDVEYWRPNWEKTPRDKWVKKQKTMIAGEKWIIDGNHTSTMELRFKAADFVIFLDLNRLICLNSVLLRNGKKRSDSPIYLEEKFDRQFFSFCKGLLNFSRNRKHDIMNLHKKYPEKPFLILKSRRNVNLFIEKLRKQDSFN